MKEKWLLEKREFEGNTFFLLKVGSGRLGKPSFIVWVSPKLVTQTQNGLFLVWNNKYRAMIMAVMLM